MSRRCMGLTRLSTVADPAILPGSFPGRSAGPGTTRATPRSTATPPKTAPESIRPRLTRRTGPPRHARPIFTLKTIQYGNLRPYFPDWTALDETALPADWMFSVVLDYGDHTSVPPTPEADQSWPLRPDPFSAYRARFEVRTYRRIQDSLPQQFPCRADGRPKLPHPIARSRLLRPTDAT